MIAVCDHFLGEMPEVLVRASCPFGGGIGGSHEETCGVVTGATMAIGALHGRASSDESDEGVRAVTRRFRERFIAAIGSAHCETIRNGLPDVDNRCRPVVETGVRILVEALDEYHIGAAPR